MAMTGQYESVMFDCMHLYMQMVATSGLSTNCNRTEPCAAFSYWILKILGKIFKSLFLRNYAVNLVETCLSVMIGL